MTRIDLKQAADQAFMGTSMIYGATRAGKTHFCATFPKVAWFGSEREGGYVTMATMDPSALYEAHVPPQVYTVNTPAELMTHLNKEVMPQVLAGQIKTIVLELSVYSDDMIRARADEATWAKYADLEKHITFLDAQWKKVKGLRVCYNALALAEDDATKVSGPLMAGKALPRKFPALQMFLGYMRQETRADVVDRVLHLNTHGNFAAGHRYGARLPRIVRNPTFRKLEALYHGRATVDADGNVNMVQPPALTGLPPLK